MGKWSPVARYAGGGGARRLSSGGVLVADAELVGQVFVRLMFWGDVW